MLAAPQSVLFLTRTYPPDPGAVGQLVQDLARELLSRGWRVGIATTTLAAEEEDGTPPGLELSRVPPPFPFTRASIFRRALSYLGIFPALWRAAKALPGDWDYIVTTSDPPLQVLLGSTLPRSEKCRLVQWSQDLYPELAEELGVLARNGMTATALRALSNLGLRRSDAIIVPGRCMAKRLRERGLAANSVHVVPNWWPAGFDRAERGDATEFRERHGIQPSHFVAMYSGNFGLAHTFDSLLAAAEQLQSSRPEIVFLLAGEGPRLIEVHAEVERRGLGNVRFLPWQPRETLPRSLAAADVHLITMREDVAGLVVPSKFYGVLAAARPCIFVGPSDSEVAVTIAEGGCGVAVRESNVDGLVAAITHYADHAEERASAGQRASAMARDFSVAASADKLLEVCESMRGAAGERV